MLFIFISRFSSKEWVSESVNANYLFSLTILQSFLSTVINRYTYTLCAKMKYTLICIWKRPFTIKFLYILAGLFDIFVNCYDMKHDKLVEKTNIKIYKLRYIQTVRNSCSICTNNCIIFNQSIWLVLCLIIH